MYRIRNRRRRNPRNRRGILSEHLRHIQTERITAACINVIGGYNEGNERKKEMLENMDLKIGGTWARDKFNWDLADTGLQKVTPDTEPVKQAVITCTIMGRRGEGTREVISAAGLAIQHPSDLYDEKTGCKVAFLNAVENLFVRDEAAMSFIGPKEYQDIWWSAYQRARNKREPVELNSPAYVLVFM